MADRCAVCGLAVVEGSGLVARTPAGTVMHGECVWRVQEYRKQTVYDRTVYPHRDRLRYTVPQAIALVKRDVRAEARQGRG